MAKKFVIASGELDNTSDHPDNWTELEELELDSRRADVASKWEYLNARREYASKVFWLVTIWLAIILLEPIFI